MTSDILGITFDSAIGGGRPNEIIDDLPLLERADIAAALHYVA